MRAYFACEDHHTLNICKKELNLKLILKFSGKEEAKKCSIKHFLNSIFNLKKKKNVHKCMLCCFVILQRIQHIFIFNQLINFILKNFPFYTLQKMKTLLLIYRMKLHLKFVIHSQKFSFYVVLIEVLMGTVKRGYFEHTGRL